MDGSGDGYLKTVCDYAHLNPVRGKLLSGEQKLREYPWSNYVQYLKSTSRRPPWLRVERLLGEMGIPKDSPVSRKQSERRMEERHLEVTGEEWKGVRRGWYLGDEEFRQELLEAAHAQARGNQYGAERQETGEQKRRRIVNEELKRRDWTQAVGSQPAPLARFSSLREALEISTTANKNQKEKPHTQTPLQNRRTKSLSIVPSTNTEPSQRTSTVLGFTPITQSRSFLASATRQAVVGCPWLGLPRPVTFALSIGYRRRKWATAVIVPLLGRIAGPAWPRSLR